MKAIILAAGTGSRLRPLTADTPKCMVKMHGQPLLRWQIDTLHSKGVAEVVVVTGYLAERIPAWATTTYHNPAFAETNMVATLWHAKEALRDDVIISYGDILFEPRVLDALLQSSDDISVVVDMAWLPYWKERFGNPLLDAETLRLAPDHTILDIGRKPCRLEDIEAQYIGLMRFCGSGLELLKNACKMGETKEKNGGVFPGLEIPFSRMYMTDLLRYFIQEGHPPTAVTIDGGWLEIDSLSDYNLATSLFRPNNHSFTIREKRKPQ